MHGADGTLKKLIGAALALGALAVAVPARAARADAPVDALARRDPALVEGVLPNGLRYAILPNRTPRQAVSIRMHVAAGALLETDAERGAAHFVEHMAFQGSRRFPGTSADEKFAAAGIGVGRDQNAFTDVNGALYVFDIPQVADAKLDVAFDWMRDVGDGLSFDPAAAVREREVVLQELAVRRTGSTELGEAVSLYSAPELLAARRSPGGTVASVRALDAETLRRFHDRWYRPERTTLVIVGDVDPAAMRARIARTFGGWRPTGPPPPEPAPGRVDPQRPLGVIAVTTPNFAQGLVQACRVAPRDPPLAPGADAWRRDGAEATWLEALQVRLRRIQRSPEAPFVTATVTRSDAYRRASFTCLSAAPKPGRWRDTLTTLAVEGRRLAAHGVLPGEASRARADLEAAVSTNAAQADTRASSGLAGVLLNLELEGRVFTTPAEEARTFAVAAPDLTAAAASAGFRRRWGEGGGPVVVVFSTTPVTTDQVRAAWMAAQAAPDPAPPVEEAVVPWPYKDFGPPGVVASRTEMKDPDFTRIAFANGVRLNFKRTAYSRNRVDVRVSFGAGQQELDPARQTAAIAAVATLGDSGLGKLDADALGRALQGRIWNASLSAGRTAFGLAGATRPADLETEMQVLAAYLTDPAFGPEAERRIPSLADSYDKGNRLEPTRVAQLAVAAALPQPHVFDPPPREVLAALKAADLAGALRPALTQAPLEVTIVGDVDEAAAVAAVARTLGALPPRATAPRRAPDAPVTRYPAEAPPVIRATHIGLRDKAAVWMVWPLYVWTPAGQREARALTLLREVVADALRIELRQKLGLTYTPSVGLSLERGGDQGTFTVAVDTAPGQVDQVVETVRGVAARFATQGVTKAELEKVRKPLLEETARRTESNGWWLSVLDGSWADPTKLDQQRTWLSDYTSLPAEEVGAAARRWLSRTPLIATATPAPTAPAPPPAASPQPATPPTGTPA